MHNGAYTTLEAAVRHQLNPVQELENYDPSQLEPEFRGAVHQDKEVIRMVKKTMPEELKFPKFYSDEEVADLVAFMKALTSPVRTQSGAHLSLNPFPAVWKWCSLSQRMTDC
jgi:cytochrome c peroxidase